MGTGSGPSTLSTILVQAQSPSGPSASKSGKSRCFFILMIASILNASHVLSEGKNGWYDAKDIEFKEWKQAVIDSQMNCQGKAYLSNIIENHDEPRGASRYLPDYARNPAGIKMLGTVNVLLRGIPFIYQGQEYGSPDPRYLDIKDFDDVENFNYFEAYAGQAPFYRRRIRIFHCLRPFRG